ncbi:Uncharacterized protein TPAR_01450 [Tolypocladium paradoxum]|uniref:Uncharacterized protein n=1 Tax=Tolypocladium paradoxum TaxID=94208 RepID=A0A2S4L7C8_9HYPO|nr:Uncharacterized protein TPAR_01450 [Tolypocladium paradoxum]
MGALGPTLRDYVQAVQDHAYTARFCQRPDDPFIASGSAFTTTTFLMKATAQRGKMPSDVEELKAGAIATGPWEESRNDGDE